MATTIASLQVLLNANTSRFSKKMTAAQRQSQKFSAVTGVMTKALGAFGVAIGGAQVIGAMRRMIDELDRLGKMSTRMQVSVDTLAGLQFAAERSGVEVTQFNKGFERMVRTIGEAKQGIGEGKRAFASLGIEVESITSLNPDKSFLRIADAISKMDTVTEKAATAQQIFGRSGVQMLNLLNEGERGVGALSERFEKLNGSFGESAVQAQKAQDALTDLNVIWKRMVRTLTIEVAPASASVTEDLGDMGEAAVKLWADVNPLIAAKRIWDEWAFGTEVAAKGSVRLSDAIAGISDEIDRVAEGRSKMDAFLKKLQEDIDFFGLSSRQRELERLKAAGGTNEQQVFVAQTRINFLKKLEAAREKVKPRFSGLKFTPRPPEQFANRFGDADFGRQLQPARTAHIASRAVDASGPNALSSLFEARQATALERSRIEEDQLKVQERMAEGLADLANVLREGVGGLQVVELPARDG